MISIEIIKPGLLTSIQDEGRPGLAYYAITASGPLDAGAARLANLLVGNSDQEPVLECNFIAPQIHFDKAATISLTGADMQWTINDIPVNRNNTLTISADTILRGRPAINGVRAYIAIQGNWQLEKTLGSYSTYSYAQFGGINGKPLQKGDLISILPLLDNNFQEIAIQQDINYEAINHIHFYPGPEWMLLNNSAQQAFMQNKYTISPNSNRMGAKLSGTAIKIEDFGKIDSSGVFPGVVQLPADGLPIVLLQDCQTTGGYPRVAVIAEEELWRFNQIRTGRKFSFYLKKGDETDAPSLLTR